MSHPNCLTGLDLGRRYDALTSINKRALERAGRRGTNVHLRAEAMLRGTLPLIPDGEPGREYDQAVDQFFDAYQPELVAAEFVVIHRTLNGHGYGCTVDARVRIDGRVYAIDWKSRGDDSDHGCYPEEAAQIAAGCKGDYMIVEGIDGPERRPMDPVDGGIVVSIRPDGCRVYPVDIDKAWSHYQAMHGWWAARLSEREPVGKPWAPRKPAVALSPADQLAQVATNPDEGGPADPAAFAAIEQHYNQLTPVAHRFITDIARDAQQHHVSFHARDHKTVRRFEILRALLAVAAHTTDPDAVRALLASVIPDAMALDKVTVGHLVGSLDAHRAARFAAHVDLHFTFDQPPVLAATSAA